MNSGDKYRSLQGQNENEPENISRFDDSSTFFNYGSDTSNCIHYTQESGSVDEKTVYTSGADLDKKTYTRTKGRKRQYLAIFLLLITVIGASFAVIAYTFDGDLYSTNDKVAVIHVQGTIITGSIPGGIEYATSEDVSSSIRKATNRNDVKSIVLRINSPGGSPSAAEEISREIERAKDKGIPVVVSMGDVATSAAYYISAPADVIMANPSTMTGSIGVVWTFQNKSEFYNDEGIEHEVIKSGEFKDMGAPWRGLTEDEEEYANEVVQEIYSNFVDHVSGERDLNRSIVEGISDGRIYTGIRAKELGLVDKFGNLYESINLAAELGDIKGEPDVVYMNKPSTSRLLFSSESKSDAINQSQSDFAGYYENNPYGKIEAK
ncbi:MAG: signal peptide peptidase SppA [Methanohalobium sp.]|uniref:signal peptide peptidase SppA n=1 Tax=Methanohalobium sp. TaxID=2837493 RepID=UPI00397E894F